MTVIMERTRVYFKLKKPIAHTYTEAEQLQELYKYMDQVSNQLYFKVQVRLQGSSGPKEFVAGYADMNEVNSENYGGEGGLVGSENGNFTHAFITVKKVAKEKWHPISVAAWQHIQVNQPELYTTKYQQTVPDPSARNIDKVGAALGLINFAENLGQLTNGFYKWAGKKRRWGRQMETGKSWIRLNVPDKVKVGGGSRVKQITLTDEWEFGGLLQTKAATYGQVYQYTTTENGEEISSGVAAYEPLMGGDEISIRTARKFSSGLPIRNSNDFFFEYPINESFYPGPSVGYSKVTVMSLASANAENLRENGTSLGFHSTTGATVQEYYTAKDFPIITDETEKNDKFGKPKINYKVIFNESTQNSIATQGYTVIQNNMHGQQKKVSNYAMDDQGNIKPDPLSYVEYFFRTEKATAHGLPALKLKNTVLALTADKDGAEAPTLEERIIGEEMDFFMDARETLVYSETDEQGFNVDLNAAPPFPIPSGFPSFQSTLIKTKSVVTNKIVSRVGILERVKAWDQGAIVETANEVWDAQTGEAIVTSVNNNFNDKIYTYNIPAHLKYDGLGPAYLNSGMKTGDMQFSKLIVKEDLYPEDGSLDHEYKENYYVVAEDALTAVEKADFYPGDEFIVKANGSPCTTMIYVGDENIGEDQVGLAFFSKGDPSIFEGNVSLFLFRSGRRNLLTAKVGSITSKTHPLIEEVTNGSGTFGEKKNYQARNRTLVSPDTKLPEVTVPICPTGDCSSKLGGE